jgi:ribosome-associated toxin RatA of RatAB toxin-antitoxin module
MPRLERDHDHCDNDPMSRGVHWCAVALVTFAGAARASEDWQRLADQEGMVIESRTVDGTSMRAVRVTTHDAFPPARIMATLWRQDEYPQFVKSFAQVDVLRDDGDTKLVYERIHVPFGSARDMTLRITRTFSAPTGVWEVVSTAVPDEGPPPSPGYVRVHASRSVWRLVPGADGGTDVSYDIRTDAGGLLPGWIVARIQKSAAAKFVRAILDRARRHP